MFHSERIGILCRHPCWSLWLEQRTTGWRFGRSEGDSKSLSAGYVPTDLLMQRTSRPVSGWFCWFCPTGRTAASVDRMSIAASEDTASEDEGKVGLPPSGVVATAASDPELTAMLAWAAVSIGLEVNRPPSPEPSWLDDSFLGAGRGSQWRSALMPFFPEVHEELTKSWMAPFTARSRSSDLFHPNYPRRRGCQGVGGHFPGGESDRSAPVPTKRSHLEEPSTSPVQSM